MNAFTLKGGEKSSLPGSLVVLIIAAITTNYSLNLAAYTYLLSIYYLTQFVTVESGNA